MQLTISGTGPTMHTISLHLIILLATFGDAITIRAWTQGKGHVQIQEDTSKNPIRKVVTLLESMVKKVEEEQEKEEELYEKFTCYCQKGQGELQKSIGANTAKVPSVQSDIQESEATVARLTEDLKQHTIDRESAKKAMGEATALRDTEHSKFVKESTEVKEYIDALAKAIPAIMKGMAGTRFLQTKSAMALKRAAAADSHLTDDDRDAVVSFLTASSSSSTGYMPSSIEVVGILKEMKADYDKDYATLADTEAEAVKLYEELISAKTKEVKALDEQIEKKTSRVGELQVDIVNMKHDMTESEAMLIADQKFLKDLESDCKGKVGEFEERKKLRAGELNAIHETIKILNSDDALDLFKKALPSASSSAASGALVQVNKRKQEAIDQVSRLLSNPQLAADKPEIRFLEMALMGKKVDFSKVIKMIDDMVALLKQEQVDDDFKIEYCRKQIDETEDRAKDLKKTISDLETNIEEKTGMIKTLKGEIEALQEDIVALDRLVADATTERKANNADFTELMTTNTEAKQLLEFAKNRLNKFYNPEMYKPPPKTETSFTEQEEVQPFAASLLQEGVVHHDDPGAAPETWKSGTVEKKMEDGNQALSMIGLLIRDLSIEMAEAQKDEKHQQAQYEDLLNDSAAKRAKMVKSINIKNSAKAESEEVKTMQEGTVDKTTKELHGVAEYEMNLHTECDWLLQNYDLRKTARADEADNLKSAKAVLLGADFSLVQAAQPAPLLSQRRH